MKNIDEKKMDDFQETDEYSIQVKERGQKYISNLQSTFIQIKSRATSKRTPDETQRLGKNYEKSIVNDFWNFYSSFSPSDPPSSDEYFGGTSAELNISTLLRLFHLLYLESIYPESFPVPIIQKSFRSDRKSGQKSDKIFIVGDTHGSFKDVALLIRKFETEIQVAKIDGYEIKIVFIGDIVDRGEWDLHNLLYLMAFNLRYPDKVLILRGNHEEISICGQYGFGSRVISQFSQLIFAEFTFMFKDLPLIALFRCDKKNVMCLHGGIPIIPLDDGKKFEIPDLAKQKFNNRQIWLDNLDSITQQILWNDPIRNATSDSEAFYPNRRGIGYRFGERVFNEFCFKNHVDLVFRGHEVLREGFRKDFDNRFITIFSASEYVGKIIDARYVELDTDSIFEFKIHVIQDSTIFNNEGSIH